MQDMPSAPNWVGSILTPLNLFCETTVATLNKNLIVGTNVQGQKYNTTVITPASYAGGSFNQIQFVYTGGGQPNCLILGNISRVDNAAMLTPVAITDWQLNINVSPIQVSVNYIAGLDANTKYYVTFLVI